MSTIFIKIFCQKLWLNIEKYSLFHQKQQEISFFSPLWLNLPKHQNTTNTIFLDSKEGYSYFYFRWECSITKTFHFLLSLLVDYQKQHEIGFFSLLWSNLPKVQNPNTISRIFPDSKEGYSYFNFRWEWSVNITAVFCYLYSLIIKNAVFIFDLFTNK